MANALFEGAFIGSVLQFNDSNGDQTLADTTIVEVTDANETLVELAFTTKNPPRRTYLHFRMGDLKRAIKEYSQ